MTQAAGNKKSGKQIYGSTPTLIYEQDRENSCSPKSLRSDAQTFVGFDRKELNQILKIYGFKVASGEWRDYAIDMLKDRAVFSVFRRASEVPLFTIEKTPKLTRRQGAYSVANGNGLIIKRGKELTQVLRVFDKKPRLAAV